MKNTFKKMLLFLLIISIMFSSLAATSLAATQATYTGAKLGAKFERINETLIKNLSRLASDDDIAEVAIDVLLDYTDQIAILTSLY